MEQPVDAIASMKAAVAKSGRKSKVQLPITFARSEIERPMLAQLMAGGQGGVVRLRLVLTLAMQATKSPFTVQARTPTSYARLLDISGDTAPRRISQALRWLKEHQVIDRMPTAVRPGPITLLIAGGAGEHWRRGDGGRFIGLPLQLWEDGWIFALSAKALAVYVALNELNGGRDHADGEFMDGFRKRQYGMSDDTWTRATVELETAGLLTTKSERAGSEEAYLRVRKRYRLIHPSDLGAPDWSKLDPPSPAQGASS